MRKLIISQVSLHRLRPALAAARVLWRIHGTSAAGGGIGGTAAAGWHKR